MTKTDALRGFEAWWEQSGLAQQYMYGNYEYKLCLGAWQAALLTEAEIEELAREIARMTDKASLAQRWMFKEYIDSVASILRGKLGGTR